MATPAASALLPRPVRATGRCAALAAALRPRHRRATRHGGATHFIPCINFVDDRGWSFQIKRTQLPVKHGAAMTVRGAARLGP